MRSVFTFVCVALALTLIASAASATIVSSVTNAVITGQDSRLPAWDWTSPATTLSATDLANQGTSSFLSITASVASNYGGDVRYLNDGHGYYYGAAGTALPFNTPTVNTDPNGHNYAITSPAFCPSDGSTVTIAFNTSVNTGGYNITSIVSLTAYADSTRVQQLYDVAVQAVGSSTWTPLYSIPSALGTASVSENCVTLQDSGLAGAAIATGVGAIQFTFHNATAIDIYREIDVNGAPTGGGTTPEPGTLTLLAAGLAGLLCYAWRKRR